MFTVEDHIDIRQVRGGWPSSDPSATGPFGLVGIVGAAATVVAGRLADRERGRQVTAGGLALLTVVALNLTQLSPLSVLVSHQSAVYRRSHAVAGRPPLSWLRS
ncbi:hypothetical protein [Streptomyces sp. PU-14G]|uniref:hypothetical protein n=1 Tax=Streptomyces sp. PU-14G TaxID=2800808 RepID=UPI0034DF7140